MPDLSTHIRTLILSDSDITDNLTTLNGSKAVFTRRPVPETAEYPFIIISPQITMSESDYISHEARDVTYDIIVYGQNDTSSNYREIEQIGYALYERFRRLSRTGMTMPTGYSLTKAVGFGPFPAPTDDLQKTARAVSATFTYFKTG